MRTQSVNVLEIPYYRLNMQEPAKTSAPLHLRMGILPVSSYMYTLSNRYNIVFIHAYKVSPNTFLTTQTIVTRETNHKRRILLKYTGWDLRPMSHLRFLCAKKSQCATVQLHAATLSRKQTKSTWLITVFLVLVGCLAKRKHTIRRVQKRLHMEQFHHFGSVFVREDRETGKVVQKPCFIYATKLQHATWQLQRLPLCRAIKSVALFFSRPRSEGWPHHGRTFFIYPCPLSFWLTIPRRVLSMSWCCPSRSCVAFFACVYLALFLALSLSPGNSLVSRVNRRTRSRRPIPSQDFMIDSSFAHWPRPPT